MRHILAVLACLTLAVTGSAIADTDVATFSGVCNSHNVGVEVTIDFTQTGGDFNTGTGTATAVFTLRNTSSLLPFQNPTIGNPLFSKFFFNLPPGTSVSYVEGRVLAGANVRSTGVSVPDVTGEFVPAGCNALGADEVHSLWYDAQSGAIDAGPLGTFSAFVGTFGNSSMGTIVDATTIVGCVEQGSIFSDLPVAGDVAITVSLSGLDLSLSSATGFRNLCSEVTGGRIPSAFAAFFKGLGEGGGQSCRVGDGISCSPVQTQPSTWGTVKSLYR